MFLGIGMHVHQKIQILITLFLDLLLSNLVRICLKIDIINILYVFKQFFNRVIIFLLLDGDLDHQFFHE